MEKSKAANSARTAAGSDKSMLEQYHLDYPPSEMLALGHRISDASLTEGCLADLRRYDISYNAATQEGSEQTFVA